MDLETIIYEVRDGVAHVRFNRPEGANAVNPQFSRELRAVMLEIEFDDAVKAASVTAEGRVFSAGGDLKEFPRRRRRPAAARIGHGHRPPRSDQQDEPHTEAVRCRRGRQRGAGPACRWQLHSIS